MQPCISRCLLYLTELSLSILGLILNSKELINLLVALKKVHF